MYPTNNISGIMEQESNLEGNHVIILLFVKPSDVNADSIIRQFNYLHYKSKKYCSIYLIGYSLGFSYRYSDIEKVIGVDHTVWEYSDQCFVEVCEQLEERLKNWAYCGEPEMIILQNSSSLEKGTVLDFRAYNYIDINYGIKKGYIDSFPRFMERFINACRSETVASAAVAAANRRRFNSRKLIERALEADSKLPEPLKDVIADKAFFKSYRSA